MRTPKTYHIRLCLLLGLLFSSCVREDTDKCVQYALNVRVVDTEGNDLTDKGVLEKTDIYLFNEKGFVRRIPQSLPSGFLFGEDKNEKLTLVAWGNLKEDTLVTTEIAPGTPIEDAWLQLRQHGEGGHLPVTDLFFSRKELHAADTRGMQEKSIVMVMERAAAGMSIRTRHLSERYPHTGTPFYLVVRGAGTRLDFGGNIAGEGASYHPKSITDGAGDVYAPPFHLLPADEERRIEIDICRNGKKLCTIDEDNDFNPICAPAGKQTNVVIDCRYVKMRADTEIVPWGETNQDTEM